MYENIIKICLVAVSVLIISILLIKRFLYFRPSSEFLPYKENYQDISEGNLHGWFIGTKGNKTILICHGNSGNISHRQHLIDSFIDLGYSVLIFDYSGYGRSRGIPSETQLYQDASVFTNMLLEFTDKNNIILYGESLGGAVASYIARKYQINFLILESSLPSVKKYIRHKFSIFGILLGNLFPEFDTVSFIKGYKGKILVMHSLLDDVIPYTITDELRELAHQTIILKGTHNNKIIPWDEINFFIKSIT